MRKQSEIAADIISSLRQLASGVQEMADCLNEEAQTTPAPAAEEMPAAPSSDSVTLEQVRTVLASLSVAGHSEEIKNLIAKYGVTRLSDIAPERLAEVLKEAERLGQ